ncbi:MAG: hypothetical protein EBT07_12155 [Actinobacteria bacterium]|nr:hypothetical protein [Actinomycetota bacterium]
MQLIPEQNPFAFIPLCFCATQRRTEGTTENPLATPTSNWNFFDVLAISKDKQEVLVVELKKGRASDSVVGQIQRYMDIALSRLRARTVANALKSRGIVPGVITGFGADNPVASNATLEGQQKNRRVEVWVSR